MRIGVDGTPLLGPRTGVGFYTELLVAALAQEAPADDVAVLPISWRTARELPVPAAGVRVVRRFAPARPLWELWNRMPFPPLELLLRCDVFHGTNFLAPPAWRTPVVVTVHDLSFVDRPETCSPAVRRFAQLLPPVLARAAAVIAVSQFTADRLATWQPGVADRLHVVPIARRIRPAEPPGVMTPLDAVHAPYVIMLGALNARKNLPLALDALAELRRSGSELRLVLAGPASTDVDAHILVAERGLQDAVDQLGYVDDATVARLLMRARLLVFPSTYEGFGMPLLEAMAAGTPVVAVAAGATVETVGDAAVLTEAVPAALADAIRRVHFDERLRAELVRRGMARSLLFSWARTARRTRAVYRSVTTGG